MGGWDVPGAGLTAPIPIRSGGDAGGTTFLELSAWVGPPAYGMSWWVQGPDEETCLEFREFSAGVGKGWGQSWGSEDDKWYVRSAKKSMWGWSAGLSYIEASLDDSSGTRYEDATLGAYASAGFLNPMYGGLVLRVTLAPDVEMHGDKWGMSGVTLSYWWGWGTSVGLHGAPVVAIGGLIWAVATYGAPQF